MIFKLFKPYSWNGIVVLSLRTFYIKTPKHQIFGRKWVEMKPTQQKLTSLHHWHPSIYISRHTGLHQQTHQSVSMTHTPVYFYRHASLQIMTHHSTSTDTAVYTSNISLRYCACWVNWTRALLYELLQLQISAVLGWQQKKTLVASSCTENITTFVSFSVSRDEAT